MNRGAIIAAVITISLAASGTYRLKGEVKDVRQEADRTAQEIRLIRSETSLLKAEWAYLSRPERLEELAGRYLRLAPLELEDRAQVAELPVRFDLLQQAEDEAIALAALSAREAAEDMDPDAEVAVVEDVEVAFLPPALPSRRPRHTTKDRLSKSYASMDAHTRTAISSYARRALRPISFEGGRQ